MRIPTLLLVPFLASLSGGIHEIHAEESVKGYPAGVVEVEFPSSGDGSAQKALFWKPDGDENVPLLVGLHTWSGDYLQAGGEAVYAKWCQKMGWAFLHPDFRGRNRSPQSMGSDLAVADIASSVEWAKTSASIDGNRIYAVGVSGGGHASLLVAGRLPDLWAGVSAWCGISDIAAWHSETSGAGRDNYAQNIEDALGGTPGSRREEADRRSPLSYLENAAGVALDINHGVNDGRDGSVPFTHSLTAWNAVVPETERISSDQVTEYYSTREIPPELSGFAVDRSIRDPLYTKRPPLFRRTNGNTRLTIFDGGHEIVHLAALNWLAMQRKGTPAVWDVPDPISLETKEADSESGK